MGISDSVNKVKDALRGHSGKADDSIDKGADMAADKADEMTGGKHSDKIDRARDMGADKAKDAMDKRGDDS